MQRLTCFLVLLIAASLLAAQSDPIALHPENPHYFLWRGRPAILITSGEHYGAVLNRPFDFRVYLATLQECGFNLTRTFSGAYCEPAGAFKIRGNTLAPAAGDLLCPWARSDQSGYAGGGARFDLTRWDAAYFQRLTEFVSEAGRHGIVVELVLFCPFYEDAMWELSPMNARNNVNGIGRLARTQVYTLQNGDLLAIQDAMVRQIVAALEGFDNVYYEICNEPYFGGVTEEWQNHIAQTIADSQAASKKKHLIAQNIANKSKKIENANPNVSIFNFHYAKPPAAVAQNYQLDRVIGDDETGFAGADRVKPYRLEAWDFLLAGGAVFSNLDYSFTVGHEQGNAAIDAPGGGGPELRRQLQILKEFIKGFDFIRMRPDEGVVRSQLPTRVTTRVLSEAGRAYAGYINGNGLADLTLDLPVGEYRIEWVNTKTGQMAGTESRKLDGGPVTLHVPGYIDDIALRIQRSGRNPAALLFSSDFENQGFKGWQGSGNMPTLAPDPLRPDRQVMKSSLDRRRDPVPNRTEVSGPGAQVGKEYWYGFRIFLPEDYVPDRIWEIVAQWHGVPDFDLGETWRNPILALSTTGGHWGWVSRWDAKRNTFASGQRQYGGSHEYDLGPYERGVWTDWVVRVKWSYEADGLLQIWQNGRQLMEQIGPNTFNDAKGPYFKMGLYKGWSDPKTPSDAVDRRVLYHDQFRMGDVTAKYEDVAPSP